MRALSSSLRRSTVVLGLCASVAFCAKPNPNDGLLKELEAKGFLKHAGPHEAKLRADILQKGWPGVFSESGRVFTADGLTLAKGGVTKFIERLRPFLEKEGVKIPVLKDDLRQESYTLLVDGAALPMWTSEDLTRELSTQPGITSALTASRSFALVNRMLETSGSKERAYALYSGAALSVMFVTDDIMAVLKADRNSVPKFMPYKLTSDFPFFGQPQS